jgi:hypothetical protein
MQSSLSGTPPVIRYVVCLMLEPASWLAAVAIGAAAGDEVAVPGVLDSAGAA